MNALAGKRVLVVEDEALIAFAVEDMLLALGCEVVGPALRLDQAQALAASHPLDAAILDVNLTDSRSYPVAGELARRGIPFVFATGYDQPGIEWHGVAAELVPKPYRMEQIRDALLRLIGDSGAAA